MAKNPEFYKPIPKSEKKIEKALIETAKRHSNQGKGDLHRMGISKKEWDEKFEQIFGKVL